MASRLRALARHMAPPATTAAAPAAIEVDPTTGIGYAELELPHRSVGKGATPERLAHLEKFGFVSTAAACHHAIVWRRPLLLDR